MSFFNAQPVRASEAHYPPEVAKQRGDIALSAIKYKAEEYVEDYYALSKSGMKNPETFKMFVMSFLRNLNMKTIDIRVAGDLEPVLLTAFHDVYYGKDYATIIRDCLNEFASRRKM